MLQRRFILFLIAGGVFLMSSCSSSIEGGKNGEGVTDSSSSSSLSTKAGAFVLTKKQIQRTLQNAFGIDMESLDYDEPSLSIHQTNRLAASHTLSDIEGYFEMTEALVQSNLENFLLCSISALNETCVESSLQEAGFKLFRRPMRSTELDRFLSIATSSSDDLRMGSEYAFIAMLNSPSFLFQTFYGQDGQLTAQEMASRIGFFIQGANPDRRLIEASLQGGFMDTSQLEKELDRLLSNRDIMADLFANMLLESWNLNRLEETATAEFYTEDFNILEKDLTEEFLRTARQIYLQTSGDIRRVFDFDKTIVNAALAQHYGYEASTSDNTTWVETDITNGRSGLFSSGLVMAAHSGNKYTSTTHRGLFIINQLLCQTVASLPNDINELIEEIGLDTSEDDTVQERIAKIADEPACGSCHKQFDPQGQVFENFDSFGRFYETRYGAPVASTTVVRGETVSSPKDLAEVILKDEDRLSQCFSRRLLSYATGNSLVDTDRITPALGLSSAEQYDFKALVKSIVLHPSFREVVSD